MFIDSSSTLNVVGKAGLNQIKNSDAGKQLLGRMYIPGIVMQAFAAELYFKALVVHEGKQIEKIHKFDGLLKLLDKPEKSIIETRMIEEIQKTKNLKESEYGITELSADFSQYSNTFEDWRYFFEKGTVNADLDFLNALTTVLHERCIALNI